MVDSLDDESTTSTPQELLYHLSLNGSKNDTIIFLHGLTSSHREWGNIAPLLSSYHLLIPDLPAHSSSAHLGPFTLDNAAERIAELIRSRAHDSICHVVGFSAGGFVSVFLAEKYPTLVRSLFVSGVYDMSASWGRLLRVAPYVAMVQKLAPATLERCVHDRMGLKLPPGVEEDMTRNNQFQMVRTAYKELEAFGSASSPATRVLAVAGGKQDDVEGTRRLGQMFKKGNDDSRAAVIEGAMHWWSLQQPQLFADGIKAWIESKALPSQFKSLDLDG
jgi:pimeloyl-ACP methyl ester carboxylesterase